MPLRSPRVRLLMVAALAMLWMGATLARLGYLQLVCYSDYLARAQRQQQRIVEISPKRGAIYDRNMRELAMSVQVESCFAVPIEIAKPEMAARLLSGVLGVPSAEIEARLSTSRAFVWIARKLSLEKAARIAALNLRGIYFQKENQRFYPKRQLAAHVLGYVDIDEKGLAGIEYAVDERVRGKAGKMQVVADARRRWFDRTEKAPDAGSSVVLTLDEEIQYIAERELATAVSQTRAQAGSIVVQDPNSGALLAVANWPPFNPNAVAESPPEARINRAIGALYEPGSTFKLVALAAALEEGIARPEEVIDCQMGAIYIAGHRIRDHKPFGLLSLTEVLAHSSDVGAIKLGLRLGAPKLYEYIRAFGFGRPTGVDLPGENHGLLRRVENWSAISIGAVSMGQEVGVTPVQLVTAMSAIANGGLLYRPHVVRELRQGERVVALEQPAPQRVVRPTTAATLRRMLEAVVFEGTGRLARLEGVTAAGKTGTAQKIDPTSGRYSRTQHIASFVGFAPLNTPAVTVLVVLDSPVGPHEGGQVAAPVFKRLTEQILTYLDVPRDVRISPKMQRTGDQRGPEQLEADLSDFDPVQVTTSAREDASTPEPALHATLTAPTGLAAEEDLTVPGFRGKSVRDVTEECLRLGFTPVLVGTGVAVEQSPEAGTTVRRGSRLTVHFAHSASTRVVSGRGNIFAW